MSQYTKDDTYLIRTKLTTMGMIVSTIYGNRYENNHGTRGTAEVKRLTCCTNGTSVYSSRLPTLARHQLGTKLSQQLNIAPGIALAYIVPGIALAYTVPGTLHKSVIALAHTAPGITLGHRRDVAWRNSGVHCVTAAV